MISAGIFVATVFSILICFVLPLGYLVVLERKRTRILRPYWMGALCFFVAEMILLLPFLNILRDAGGWYANLAEKNTWAYAVFLAAMTAIFEGAARFLFISFALKERNRWIDAVSMGVGQGLVAAMFTGVTLVGMIFYYVALNGGVLGEVSGLSGDELAQMEAEIRALGVWDLIFLGIEQLCVIAMQVGYSVMVYKCVKGRQWALLPVSMVWQMLPNIMATVLTPADGGTNLWLEAVYLLLGAAGLFYAWHEKNSSVWGVNVDKGGSGWGVGRRKQPTKSIKEIMKQMPK